MTHYLYAGASSWEEWQKEYRYGAFYIFPPTGVIEPIDELRKKYDHKSHAYCQAHISLSEPLKNELREEQLTEIKSAPLAVEPFEIHYGPLRIFPPYSGVAYAIHPEDKPMRLRSLVHSTSIFRDVPLKRAQISPHMTIA
jgi:2'-5' RNA ligase